MNEMMEGVEKLQDNYDETNDKFKHKNDMIDAKDAARHAIFDKGLSKRIWEELYKVIDSSDVVIYVLDARNPDGTRTHLRSTSSATAPTSTSSSC
jgi:nuclear GTP-binding protein